MLQGPQNASFMAALGDLPNAMGQKTLTAPDTLTSGLCLL
jgi:hypothetical protein